MNIMIYRCIQKYTLGATSFALDIYVDENDMLLGIFFVDSRIRGKAFRTLFVDNTNIKSHPNPASLKIVKELEAYMQGRLINFTAPYRFVAGTDFQKAVWKEIAAIPPQHAVSYCDIAKKICLKNKQNNFLGYSRAVGTATGTNPLSIVVPCHRVLPKHSISNFTSAIANKRVSAVGNYGGSSIVKFALLELEQHAST